MSLTLSQLSPSREAKNRKRVGRGDGSGHGTYAGRGSKGQRARSGGRKGLSRKAIKIILKVVPKKRGFKSIYPKKAIINLNQLNNHFKDGELVTYKKIIDKNIIKYSPAGFKVLGEGTLTKKLTVEANVFSEKAKEAILKLGGQVKQV